MWRKLFDSIINLIKYLLIAGIGPACITFLFAIFTLFYWGGGFIVFGIFFIMTLVCGIGSLIIVSILKNRSTFKKILATSIFAFIIGMALQLLEYSGATPTKLKNAILNDSIQDLIQVDKGRMFNIGFEHEIYLKLESTPELATRLLRSNKFEPMSVGKGDNQLYFSAAPDWFPVNFADRTMDAFGYTNYETEEKHIVLISKNKKTIYYFYLQY